MKSLFKITAETNSFSIGTHGYWKIPNYLAEGVIDTLKKLLRLRSQDDMEFHVKEVEKRGARIEKKQRI